MNEKLGMRNEELHTPSPAGTPPNLGGEFGKARYTLYFMLYNLLSVIYNLQYVICNL